MFNLTSKIDFISSIIRLSYSINDSKVNETLISDITSKCIADILKLGDLKPNYVISVENGVINRIEFLENEMLDIVFEETEYATKFFKCYALPQQDNEW